MIKINSTTKIKFVYRLANDSTENQVNIKLVTLSLNELNRNFGFKMLPKSDPQRTIQLAVTHMLR